MLNKNNERELAYLVEVNEIAELPGYDRVESARVNGWWCIVPKGQFSPGSIGIYFEIDSLVDATNPAFSFMEKRNYRVKTQKMCKSISQGLLMHPSDFGWKVIHAYDVNIGTDGLYVDDGKELHSISNESRFLTKALNVKYYEPEDNQRKAPSIDKYKKMAQRNPQLAKTKLWRFLYKYEFGKKVLFFFFGKKRDKKNGWPAWVVKTDEERVQNMPWILQDKSEWIVTEKLDGTSTTFTVKGFGRKRQFYVCSRNVVFDTPDKNCYYDTNVYTEMAEKYNIKEVMFKTLDYLRAISKKSKMFEGIEFITIQAETFGNKIQNRDYGMKDHDMRVFNIIYGYKDGSTVRLNPVKGKEAAENAGLKFVPIVNEHYMLPDTVEEVIAYSHGDSQIDGGMREGLVFRSLDGTKSFKAVDPEFLLKYHS